MKDLEKIIIVTKMCRDMLSDSVDPLNKAKAEALEDLISRTHTYINDTFDEWIVERAFVRRFDCIENAKTMEELNALADEPRPKMVNGEFVPGRYDLPEEELFKWILANEKKPIGQAGQDRLNKLLLDICQEESKKKERGEF